MKCGFWVVLCCWFLPAVSFATPFTPLAWQHVVDSHANPALVGQRKHTTWSGDLNRNFIDDQIELRFKRGDRINVTVELNRCLMPAEIEKLAAGMGTVRHVGQLITFVVLDQVRFDDLATLATQPDVAMIEWRAPDVPEMDVASRAIQARSSAVYAGQSAEDLNITGTGINVAVVDAGVDDGTGAQASLPASKFVAGFDSTDPNDPANGIRNPTSAGSINHGSVMAAIALGNRSAGRECRPPSDDTQAVLACGGIAPGAGLVDVKMCGGTGANFLCQPEAALDWVGTHARQFNIRVVLYAYSRCGNDDGNGALAQQANFLTALGMVFVAAYGNAPGPCTPANQIGQQLTKQPASGSFVLSVTGSEGGTTINRNDDAAFANRFVGPRNDWNMMTPNLLALKPDITAPQNMSIHQSGTIFLTGIAGTSPAAAVTAGAAALLLQRFPAMTPDSVKQALLQSADATRNTAFSTLPGPWGSWDSSLGWGLLNVGNAINRAIASTGSPRFVNCNTPSPTGPEVLCTLRDGKAVWDNTTDIEATTMPKVGSKTTIRAHVINQGNGTATFLVNFGVYIFSAGNNQFHHIGTKQVTLTMGQDQWVEMQWTPAATDHQCIQVSISYGLDADYSDNLTQRNFQILPSQYALRVENPLFTAARMDVVPTSHRAGWQCRVSNASFPLDPFKDCAREVTITFDAPKAAKPGEQADCDVAVYATPIDEKERKLVGGVTVRTFVPRPCRAWGELVDARGQPIAGARIRVARIQTADVSTKSSRGKRVDATVDTNKYGVFDVPIAPDARYRFMVDKRGVGRGALVLRPGCGLELPRLTLTAQKLEAELVHYYRGSL